MKKKRKSHHAPSSLQGSFELNVMPFIDIFSLLCTFLLFSAVFVSMGILEVQVPFITSAKPEKSQDKPKRSLDIKIDVTKETVDLTTKWSLPPIQEKKETFANSKEGLRDFHSRLLDLKEEDEDADKATLFVDDEIIYKDLVHILDTIKLKNNSGKIKNSKKSNPNEEEDSLFPKVVMGSVIL